MPTILHRCPNVKYIIVGTEPRGSAIKYRGGTVAIREAARGAGVETSIVLAGRLTDEALLEAYETTDVLIFPSRGMGADLEGFGMVIVEAASYGVPSVAFDTGGVSDAMSSKNGILVAEGDYCAFTNAVVSLIEDRGDRLTDVTCLEHAKRYSWEFFDCTLIKVIDTLLFERAKITEPPKSSVVEQPIAANWAEEMTSKPRIK